MYQIPLELPSYWILHLQAWKEGLKTTYYVRSTSNDVEECEWCQS